MQPITLPLLAALSLFPAPGFAVDSLEAAVERGRAIVGQARLIEARCSGCQLVAVKPDFAALKAAFDGGRAPASLESLCGSWRHVAVTLMHEGVMYAPDGLPGLLDAIVELRKPVFPPDAAAYVVWDGSVLERRSDDSFGIRSSESPICRLAAPDFILCRESVPSRLAPNGSYYRYELFARMEKRPEA